MKRWRAAVIGGGFIGRVHAEALHRLPQAELTALCDPERAQQKAEAWNVPHAYADYRELVEQERPEVVHICTPNATHYEIAKFALVAGAGVDSSGAGEGIGQRHKFSQPVLSNGSPATCLRAAVAVGKNIHGARFLPAGLAFVRH